MVDGNLLKLVSILGASVIGDDAVFELICIFTCGSEAHKAIGLIITLDFKKLTVVEVVVLGICDGSLWTFIFKAKALVQKFGSLGLPDNDSGILNGTGTGCAGRPLIIMQNIKT